MLSSTRSKCGDLLLRLRAAKSPRAEHQLHSTPEFGQVLAKFLRQKTNSTVLPLHSREGLAGIRPSTVLPLHSREGLAGIRPSPMPLPLGSRSCGPQMWGGQRCDEKLYSTCASPVVPHPSTGHAHGCLASEIGRDPAFPTRFDRTVGSLEVSLLASSSHWIGTESERVRY